MLARHQAGDDLGHHAVSGARFGPLNWSGLFGSSWRRGLHIFLNLCGASGLCARRNRVSQLFRFLSGRLSRNLSGTGRDQAGKAR